MRLNEANIDLFFFQEDDFHSRLKKSEKKSRKKAAICENVIEAEFEEKLNSLSRPQLKDLWPLRLTCWLYVTTLNTPHYYSLLREYLITSWNKWYIKQPEPEEDADELVQGNLELQKKNAERKNYLLFPAIIFCIMFYTVHILE